MAWPDTNNWFRRSLGGALMGAGGALAVASYVALLAGIASVLLTMRLIRGVRT